MLEFINLCGKGIIYDSYISFYDFLVSKQEIIPKDIVDCYSDVSDKLKEMERVDLTKDLLKNISEKISISVVKGGAK